MKTNSQSAFEFSELRLSGRLIKGALLNHWSLSDGWQQENFHLWIGAEQISSAVSPLAELTA